MPADDEPNTQDFEELLAVLDLNRIAEDHFETGHDTQTHSQIVNTNIREPDRLVLGVKLGTRP